MIRFVQRAVTLAAVAVSMAAAPLAVDNCVAAEDHAAPVSSAMAPTVPDTLAGKTLQAWLIAFNTQDDSALKAYLALYQPLAPADEEQSLHDALAGVELIAVTKSLPNHIEFLIRAKSGATIRGKFDVDDKGHPLADAILAGGVPPGVTADDVTLDKSSRHEVIEGMLAKLDDSYIFPELAAKMRASVLKREAKGEYDAIDDGDVFAKRLTDDLRSVSHHKHLGVYFSPYRVASVAEDVDWREPSADERDDMLTRNCGFERVEILKHNVGYIRFNSFEDPDVCGATVAAALAFVANADALIFDLRGNGGGDPQTVQLIASYLFAEPTHLNDLFERKGNKTTQYWTLPYLPGKRILVKPVYVLTSSRTFSGGEEFAYDLKNQKRATIVGEQTGGGAHPVSGHQIAVYFNVFVPFAKAINPVSKTDWEGVGVEPDVKVPAGDALGTAQPWQMVSSKNRSRRLRLFVVLSSSVAAGTS